MSELIEPGFMVFLKEGAEGIGAVRATSEHAIVVYVENSGEFSVPRKAVVRVHDQKVILDRHALPAELIEATRHSHEREDPKLVG
jgi:hypothetical protein